MAYGTYSAILTPTAITTTKVLVQVNAASTVAVEVLRCWITNTESETSTAEEAEIIRRTTAGTPGSAYTPLALGGYAAAASTAGVNYSADGTAGDSLWREGFNILDGWMWEPRDPTGRDRIFVPPSGRISIRFSANPEASTTVTAGILFAEVG